MLKPLTLRAGHGEAAMAFALAALGAGMLWFGRGLELGDANLPGPGVLPRALGVLLIVLGLAAGFRALARAGASKPVAVFSPKVLLSALCLFGAVIGFESLGFLPTAVLFLSILLFGLGEVPLWRAILTGGALAVAAWALFDKALGVNLPAGVFGF